MSKPVVAIVIAHYLPGSKGGGPIRLVANLVEALGDEFDFRILTRDRDLNDRVPYPGLPRDEWIAVGKARVRYLPPRRYTPMGLARAIRDLGADLVFAQSYFSPFESILPRLLLRQGRLDAPLLVAPHGEFSPGALAIKARKKRLFLRASRALGLDRGVRFHATGPEEAAHIRAVLGSETEILVARPFPTPDDRPLVAREKVPGDLEAIFVSRVSPKKNLLGAIELLAGIEGVRLTVHGPKEDAAYWRACRTRARELGVSLVEGGVLAPEAVRGAFERAHVFLFPTLGENYGYAIEESLAAGTPVLLSDRTPWRDLRPKGVGWDLALEDRAGFRAVLTQLRGMDDMAFAASSRRASEYARALREDPAILAESRALLGRAIRPIFEARTRPVAAVLVGHYLPGSKGGGPIRSVANLVAALGDEWEFRVLAMDRDLGDDAPYPGIRTNEWISVGKASVLYLSPERANRRGLASVLSHLRPDLVYAQSYFSPLFSIVPRLLRRTGRLECPLLVAPRGEFSPGALALKGRKKRLFLALAQAVGLDRGVIWHATAPEEAQDLQRTIGSSARILLAPPLPTPDARPLVPREKRPGELRVVWISRIAPKKNLLGAIELLADLPGASLTVHGPKEDGAYWVECAARAVALGVELRDGGPLAPEEVRPAFERGHLFLFPTLGENYGHAIFEALAAGTPVLLSDQTPWRGLRAEGIGWEFALDDRASFRTALEEMLAMNAQEFADLSRRAYEVARARREDPSVLRSNRDLLRDAIALAG